MDTHEPRNLDAELCRLKPKGTTPRSVTILNNWIIQAERDLHSGGGRLGWLVATTVVTAMLQQATDQSGRSRFFSQRGYVVAA